MTTHITPDISAWEAAYQRFETPEQEIRKFKSRLKGLGVSRWKRNSRVVEIFCGRGNGMVALNELGFDNVEGVDFSAALLAKYRGPAKTYCCDARKLPFEDASRDIIIVQGGMHHLPTLPDDLEKCVSEVARSLTRAGRFVAVEPWPTPFLHAVHFLASKPAVRKMSVKVDALQTMIENERETYEAWLSQPKKILSIFKGHFEIEKCSAGWGKLSFVGRKR